MSLGTVVSRLAGHKTFARGVHPHDWKELSSQAAIELVDTPASVCVPLVQHAGAPAEPVVQARQIVTLGQLLGQNKAFITAPVHAPIAGAVSAPSMTTLANGRHVPCLSIQAQGEQLAGRALWEDLFGGDWPSGGFDRFSDQQISQAVRDAGLVGLGGAGFPTHVKLARNPNKPVDTLLVNGSECEPYLTADYRLMLEAPKPIITGAILLARAAGAGRIVIALEDNKPDAVASLRAAAQGTDIQVVATVTKYPMGGEKQLIVAVLGRAVPTGGLPLDCGVVVVNVGTSAAAARAVLRGKPLTHRIVTVSGRGVNRPCNLLAPVGMTYGQLIHIAGGLNDRARRVLAGGPMMGFAVSDLSLPITKGTSGITVLIDEDLASAEQTNCVKCGRCADVCPLNLVPTRLAQSARAKNWDLARRYYITACMECGCCAYACPASIPLVQIIRAGKAGMPKR